MRNLLSSLLVAPLALVLSGCLIYPHTSERSPEIRGRVFDADTRQPIAGAKVSWLEQSRSSTKTDAAGAYTLHKTHNLHWMVSGPCASDWPMGRDLECLWVSHLDYAPTNVNVFANVYARDFVHEGDTRYLPARDILLHRK